MRTCMFTAVAVALLFGAAIASAATQQWSYERPISTVLQIVCDGSGGCALAAQDTNGLYRIAWLSSKGEVMYEKVLPSGTNSTGIMSCDKSGLLYSVAAPSGMYLVYVDKKGVETTITDPANNIMPCILGAVYNSRFSDKKGYFASKVALAFPNIATVVRYSYK